MILVLGGTSDSIEICNLLNEKKVDYIVSVTTSYGEDLAKKCSNKIKISILENNKRYIIK